MLDKKGWEFMIERVVKHGDPLSLNLFNSVIEKISSKMGGFSKLFEVSTWCDTN